MLHPAPCTVWVVDDDPSVLRMLAALVDTIGVCARPYPSAEAFFAAYRPDPCECLICDMRMPGMGGLDVQRRLKERGAELPIIFLTGYAEVSAAVEAMKAGAVDFVEKPFGAQVLLDKIQKALARSREVQAQRRLREAREARVGLLTPKERAVVRGVVDGKSSRDISAELGISVRTVENHRARIMEKLHVRSTVELVRLFA